jgi:DNA-binding transcriptional LysR family regulator
MLPLHETSIRKLKIFCTAVDSGGFSAAQALLNISAATISVQMKELEAQLGVTLCRRGRSGFALTEQGEAVYEAAQRVLSSFGTFNLEVANVRNRLAGEIRIGLQPNMATNPEFRLSQAMQIFHKRENDVRFRIEETRSAMQEARVLEGKYDLAVGLFSNRMPGLDYRLLLRERIQMYCAADHPLTAMTAAGIKESLKDYALVSAGQSFVSQSKHLSANAAPSVVTESMDASVQLISSGCYIGFLPTHFADIWEARGQIRPVLPEELWGSVDFFLITRKEIRSNSVVDVFVQDMIAAHSGT